MRRAYRRPSRHRKKVILALKKSSLTVLNWCPLLDPGAICLDIFRTGGIELSQKTVERGQSLVCSLVSHRSLIGGRVEFSGDYDARRGK
jgi:hypothetical protein